jgi:hypothetical protein
LRVVVGTAPVASLVINVGIIDPITAIAPPGPEWESARMLEGGWGSMFGVVLPIALAGQMRRGGRPVARRGSSSPPPRRWHERRS